jgi:uncharacterized FlaG/YvyC family protein
MDLVKPIEGSQNDARGQGAAIAETVRERYYQQHAQPLPPVKPPDAAEKEKAIEKHSSPPEDVRPQQSGMGHTYAEFEVNRDTREVTIRIIDAETGKLVRTVPPEDLAREIARGNLYPNQLRRRAVFV